jgi:hypothetical protein
LQYVKIVQYNNNVVLGSNAAAVNDGGVWVNSEINLNAGKLSNTNINSIIASAKSTSMLWRVIQPSDNLFNSGAGTGGFFRDANTPFGAWGTVVDLNEGYMLRLDKNGDGTWDHGVTYTSDTRGVCNSGSYFTDHNYNGACAAAYPAPPVTSYAICWAFMDTCFNSNLHWMSGQAAQSGPVITSGAAANSAFAAYILG